MIPYQAILGLIGVRNSTIAFAHDAGTVPVTGAKLRYVVQGKGEACLVIGSSVYYPRTFSAQLKHHLRMIFVDMRWFASVIDTRSSSPFTLDSIIEDIEAVRTALHLDHMILVGHSIHGAVAFEYARRHPEHVSRLILIGAPPVFGNQFYDQATYTVWKSADFERQSLQSQNWKRQSLLKFSPAQQIVEDYLSMAPKYWFNPRYDARWLWKGVSIQPDLLHSLYQSLFKDYHMFDSQSGVPVKTFVAQGQYDFVIPASLWKGYRGFPGLTLKLFAKSGHTPQLEEPENFDGQLLDWLNRSTSSGK